MQKINAPLQATVVEWLVAAGDVVTKDQLVVVVEAMKMKHEIRAGCDGRITECLAKAGDLVQQGELLATITNEPNNGGRVQGAASGDSSPDPQWLATRSIKLSAKTGAGLNDLRSAILKTVGWQAAPEGLFIARQRHVHALQGVGEHLELAREHLESKSPALEVIAEELRLALNDLSSITGEFTPDDLLGEIFSKFCIGK